MEIIEKLVKRFTDTVTAAGTIYLVRIDAAKDSSKNCSSTHSDKTVIGPMTVLLLSSLAFTLLTIVANKIAEAAAAKAAAEAVAAMAAAEAAAAEAAAAEAALAEARAAAEAAAAEAAAAAQASEAAVAEAAAAAAAASTWQRLWAAIRVPALALRDAISTREAFQRFDDSLPN